MANNKNDETKKVGVNELLEYVDKVFPQYGTKDQGKLIYLLNWAYDLDETEKIFRYCNTCDSFEHIGAVANLYSYLKSHEFDDDVFVALVADYYGNTRKVETLNELINSLRSDLSIDRIKAIVHEFASCEELIVAALKASRYIMDRKMDSDLHDLILVCKSREAMKLTITLYKRGSTCEEIISKLYRYKRNGESQVMALKQENLKRIVAGTIRNDVEFCI